MEPWNAQKLKAAIRAVLEQGGGLSDSDIAALVAKNLHVLVTAWAQEILTALVRSLRKRMPSDAAQMEFPFHDLSIQLPREKKIAFELRSATIGMLKESERFLMAQKRASLDKPARASSVLGRIQREIEVMQPWVYNNRRITVEQVHKLVASGTQPPPRPTVLSQAMKRFWDSKTPDERSEIAQLRQAKRYRKSRPGNRG